jgi:YVTN family beta-propeller protein
VSVINTATNTVTNTITGVGGGGEPGPVALSPDGARSTSRAPTPTR